MCKKIVEVKKEGGGQIILPGQIEVKNPVFELREDLLEHMAITKDQFEEVYRDIHIKYDLLESHLKDLQAVYEGKQRDMIACIRKLEKLIVEQGFKK